MAERSEGGHVGEPCKVAVSDPLTFKVPVLAAKSRAQHLALGGPGM